MLLRHAQRFKRLLHVGQVIRPLFSQRHAAFGTDKQCDAQMLLELADLLADGGGGQRQAVCRSGQAAGTGGGFKRQNGAQFGQAAAGRCVHGGYR
ncbi:hypothetical protein D3C72_1101160 [compost metagenome]